MEKAESLAQDINKCCRTCMCFRSDMVNMHSSTSEDKKSLAITEMLKLCTSIQVDINDGLPSQICNSCLEQLTNAFTFRNNAETVDKKLREQLPDIKISPLCKLEPSETEIDAEINTEFQDDNVADMSKSDSESEKPLKMFETPKAKNGKYRCHLCVSTFMNFEQLKDHMTCHGKLKSKLTLGCKICKKKFDKVSKLTRHAMIHDPNVYPFGCSHCPLRFKRKTRLNHHNLSHNIKPKVKTEGPPKVETFLTIAKFICNLCSESFQSSHSLCAHMRKHTVPNRVLACSICKKEFKKISHLKRHERSHEDYKRYKCTHCNKSYSEEAKLTDHINSHKGIRPYSCPQCGKSFSQVSTLNAHVKNHSNERPYLCPTCGKRFDLSTNLNQHMKRHLGLKTFACSMCPGRFVSKGELRSHMSIHTGLKPYVCDTCGSTFTKPNSLAKHKLRHLGIKPHECDVCFMRFTSKDHLKRHYRIHTGEKPYKCDMCERAFTQSNDLIKHKRSHLGDKLYKCTQCTESFRLKTELRNHESSHYISQNGGKIPSLTPYQPSTSANSITEPSNQYSDIPNSNEQTESKLEFEVENKSVDILGLDLMKNRFLAESLNKIPPDVIIGKVESKE